MYEKYVVNQIKDYLRKNYKDSFYFVTHGNMFQKMGLPDLIACISGRFVGIEVKAPGKKPSKLQFLCLKLIEAAGGIGIWADSLEVCIEKLELKLKEGL